jgi:hypothetical protein
VFGGREQAKQLELAGADYVLVSTMPRLVLDDRAAALAAAGVSGSCALIVKPVAAA